jgi:hypothetical protein
MGKLLLNQKSASCQSLRVVKSEASEDRNDVANDPLHPAMLRQEASILELCTANRHGAE